jgi:hypothetical protein
VSGVAGDALTSAVDHFLGQTRAYLILLEGVQHEIGSLHDDRAGPLVESMRLTLREPAEPGTLRHVERAVTELARALRP